MADHRTGATRSDMEQSLNAAIFLVVERIPHLYSG